MLSRRWTQHIPVIPVLGKLSLGNTVRSCHKRQKNLLTERQTGKKGGGEQGRGKKGALQISLYSKEMTILNIVGTSGIARLRT